MKKKKAIIDKKTNPDRWDAQHYKKHSKGQYQRGIAAIEKLNLQGNEHVLDIGCGDGRITAKIAYLSSKWVCSWN